MTEYEPRLATAYEVSSDNMTFTFTLRDGVTFHSGNPFSCKDVAYSIKRLLVVNPADSGGWILMEPLTGSYGNAAAELGEDASERQYADFYKTIDNSVTCPGGPNGLSVKFNLAQADPAFFAKTIFYGASVVDKAWAVENGMWDGTEATWRGLDRGRLARVVPAKPYERYGSLPTGQLADRQPRHRRSLYRLLGRRAQHSKCSGAGR